MDTSTPLPSPAPGPRITPGFAWSLVLATTIILFALRLAMPADIMDNDQERPAAYILDSTQNGRWIVQLDQSGEVMSKPPLSTWISAVPAALFNNGELNFFLLYLPSFLSTLGIVALMLGFGSRAFGREAALLGTLTWLLSMIAYKQIALVRTDPVFACTTFATALFAWRAWGRGRGWAWAWLWAALSTLTKGPLGLVLAAGGLIAVVWERRRGEPLPLRGRMGGGFTLGIALFVGLCGGWFWLAYRELGQPLVDKMIGRELVGHAITDDAGKKLPLMSFYMPALYFIARWLPWSLPAIAGLVRVFRAPAAEAMPRRFERFLACYFLFGLAIFSASPHQRADHLMPLIPAAAMLAGPWLAGMVAGRNLKNICMLASCGFLCVAAVYGTLIRGRSEAVAETRAVQEFAAKIEFAFGRQVPPIIYTRSVPFGVQFYLNTMNIRARYEDANRALAGELPAFVALEKPATLPEGIRVIVEPQPDWPTQWCVISNQPLPPNGKPWADIATIHEGRLMVELHNAQWMHGNRDTIRVMNLRREGSMALTNLATEPSQWTIDRRGTQGTDWLTKTISIASSETVRLKLDAQIN